jgi:hypothetical protein
VGLSEQVIQQRIRLELGRGPVRLWRNNVGALRDEHGRLVRYGLAPGSSDLIGLRQLRVGAEHQGQVLAVFSAIEVKAPRGAAAAGAGGLPGDGATAGRAGRGGPFQRGGPPDPPAALTSS